MADEYPVFGTGPGTFAGLFQFYRHNSQEDWFVQLHNDWLETLITFGAVGVLLITAAFLLVITRWFVPGGMPAGRRLPMLIGLSLAGCIVAAFYDFPFQTYSVAYAFMMLCAILFSLSRGIAFGGTEIFRK